MKPMYEVLENARASSPAQQELIDRLKKLQAWLDAGAYRLQRPNEPVWHKLKDAWRNKSAEVLMRKVDEPTMESFCADDTGQVFLIGHDWAKAFQNATDFSSGEYRLPYTKVCFELIVNQRRVCVLAEQDEGAPPSILYWVNTEGVWVGVSPKTDSRDGSLGRLIEDNLRAVCIALDAEVAYTEVIRAPHKLNKARAKQGRSPITDYRVVKLVNKTRAAPADEAAADGPKKRLHFRRGHWRHFDTFKTWIRWTLVGDPDLGFVDKHYRF